MYQKMCANRQKDTMLYIAYIKYIKTIRTMNDNPIRTIYRYGKVVHD